MYLDTVKKIAANVLYIDNISEIGDNNPLAEYGFSSIDYIDLCYELKSNISEKITPENLWPFNAMSTTKEYFDGTNWTPSGWKRVCDALGLEEEVKPIEPKDLGRYFTPVVLSRRVTQIVNG
ncbi:acyl carrier protein [Mesorhizobium sp. NPDC059054]|uniref:acyl carrier protein n=1 Tax=unclassified Mesorhizobium TaxID=325217 RepID=UPI0036B86F2A